MTPLLGRVGLRHLTRHPWQIGLAVLGVALGVAMAVAVDLANASASRAFALATEAVTGRATHQVVGGPGGLPEAVFPRLVGAAPEVPFAPVVEEWVSVRGPQGRRLLHLLGVDPFAEAPFRPYLSGWNGEGRQDGLGSELRVLLTRPGTALLTAETARELGVPAGGGLPLALGDRTTRVTLAGTLEPRDANTRRALADLLLVDVATAQELLGRSGVLSRIDLRLEGPEAGRLARLRAALPPGAAIVPTAARSQGVEEMSRAFRLNLTALSLLALVCGGFLIYNTITFSVIQRRTLFGTLRALGVTRREVFGLILAETVAVALVGTAAGLGAGVLLGHGLVRLITQTINDFYFVVSVREPTVSALSLARGAAVGIGATLLAALAPAWEATTTPPRAVLSRSTLEASFRRRLPAATRLGAALLLAGAGLLAVPRALVANFAGLFGIILGFALLAPAATVALMRPARALLGRTAGVLGRMAAGGVVASLSRTAVAIAALVVAVSVTVGVGVMIDSFRRTVDRWLDASLQSDLYVSLPARGGGFSEPRGFDPALADRAAALPGVTAVHRIRRVELPEGAIRLVAIDLADRSDSFEIQRGDPARIWPAVLERGAVLVSEPFARRYRVGPGDRLPLRTADGVREFAVAGVYTDYSSDQGLVLMERRTYVRHWRDETLSGFALALDGSPVDPALRDLRRLLAGSGAALSVQSNRDLREGALAVFDRTFRITGVLRLLAGIVAFIGVLAALLALQLERARELAVLRATGLTPGQVWGLVTTQTGLIGLTAGLLSLPVGLALAAIMIFVINRRSFGWTIHLTLAPEILAGAVALALAAAVLAGLYPAWKMARTSPALALREE